MYAISLLPEPVIRVYRECTSIGKVAWFAVYIFGNLWNAPYIFRYLKPLLFFSNLILYSIYKQVPKIAGVIVNISKFRHAQNGLILYLCNIYIYSIYLWRYYYFSKERYINTLLKTLQGNTVHMLTWWLPINIAGLWGLCQRRGCRIVIIIGGAELRVHLARGAVVGEALLHRLQLRRLLQHGV